MIYCFFFDDFLMMLYGICSCSSCIAKHIIRHTHIGGVLLDLVLVAVRGGDPAAPEAVLAHGVVGAARAAVAEAGEGTAAAGAAG